MIARLTALVLVLAPGTAWACATCVSSAYGDRTFNSAFLGLILMPFVVATDIAGGLAAYYYAPLRSHVSFRAIHWRFRAVHWRFRAPDRAASTTQLPSHEESSL